jgi:hypothetical protein
VQCLTGPEATRENIIDGLDWLRTRVENEPDATVVLCYTGHGELTKGGDYYLIPYDCRGEAMRATGLAATAFAEVVGAIGAARLLVLMDCCYAAGMGVKGPAPAPRVGWAFEPALLLEESPNPADTAGSKGLETLKSGLGRAVLSSSTGMEPSYSHSSGEMSLFMYHAIGALTGHAAPAGAREVLVSDILGHVTRNVPVEARGLGQKQTPQFRMTGDNFPVARLLGGKGMAKGQVAPDPLADLAPSASSSVVVQGDNNTVISASGPNAKAGGPGAVVADTIHGNVTVDNRKSEKVSMNFNGPIAGGTFIGKARDVSIGRKKDRMNEHVGRDGDDSARDRSRR